MSEAVADVVVAGAGPAGWAIARECALLGLRTQLVAPRPAAPWRATYGMWLDEAELLPPGAGYVVARARVFAGAELWLAREYAVLDNASVRAALAHPDVVVRTGTLADVVGTAPVVVDATGAGGWGTADGGARAGRGDGVRGDGPAGGGGAGRGGGAEQTAYGVVVPAEVAAPVAGPGEAVFMDWRPPLPGPPTFLYAVPRPDGRVLLEETSLARRPGLPFARLRERLLARLARHGIDPGDAPVERVRIPLDVRPPRPALPGPPDARRPPDSPTPPASRAHAWWPAPTRSRGAPLMPFYRWGVTGSGGSGGLWTGGGREWSVVPFGAAAGMVHPATGFSVADALRVAPRLADAVAAGGAGAARRAVWPARARAVHRLRRAGLHTLLALGPGLVEEFFALFFALPAHHQRAFLSGREDLAGTAAAMAALFRAAPWSLRRTMMLR